jgi:hypothetical protein
MTLDIHRDLTSEVSLDLIALIDKLAYPNHLIIRQVIALGIELNPRGLENFSGGAPPNSVDVSKRNLHSLVFRQIHSGDARHIFTPYPLPYPFSILGFGF